MTASRSEDPRTICDAIVKYMRKGMLMPFFGAGVNLANRPEGFIYDPTKPYLPNAAELSDELLKEFKITNLPHPCVLADPPPIDARCKWKEQSLVRVSWYVSRKKGKSDLYEHLHNLFGRGTPGDVHRFFAQFRKRLEEKGYEVRPQLIVTTNYDRLLEDAFDEAGEPYDVFSYKMDDKEHGKFNHTPYKGTPTPVKNPTKYYPEINHTIILKIHGTADPTDWRNSTFVITEDDYIDYAAFIRYEKFPSVLASRMVDNRFLYLGYSLSDWNFRVFLRGIKEHSQFSDDRTWAIMHRYDEWDRLYWEEHKVDILQMHLSDHIQMLNEVVDDLPKV